MVLGRLRNPASHLTRWREPPARRHPEMSAPSSGMPIHAVASPPRYRWIVLSAGTLAQASISAVQLSIPVLAPELRSRLHLTLGETGIVLAAYAIGTTTTLVPWGLLVDRFGERITLPVGVAATALAMIGAEFAHGFASLTLCLTAAGAFSAGGVAASGRAVMQWFPVSERGLALGIRQASVPAGGLLVALALPPLARSSLHLAFISLAALCLLSAIVGAWCLRESGTQTATRASWRKLRSPALWIISFGTALLVVGQVATLSFIVLFLHAARGFAVGDAAAVYAGTLICGIALRIVAGHWSDSLGTRILPIRRLALGVSATLVLVAILTSANTWILVAALLLAGALGHSWAGLPFVLAAERAGAGSAGIAIGFQQTAAGIGAIIGPIGFAAVVASASWRIAFLTSAVFPILAWLALRPLTDE
jgi:sugar phosphate permease